MTYNPDLHHRRSIRLQGYDYAQAGAYFVTICTQHRECLFGEITDGEMRLNDPGWMIERWYYALEKKYPDIQCDALVCMPNHTHFIIVNVGADPCVRPVSPDDPDATNRADLRIHRDAPDATKPPVGADQCVRPLHVRPNFRDAKHIKKGEHTGSPLQHVRPPNVHSDPRDVTDSRHIKKGEPMGSPLQRVVQWFKTMTTNDYIRGVKQHGWRPFPGKLWQRNYWEHVVRNESELNQIREYIQHNPAQWETDRLYRCDIPDQSGRS